MARNGYRIFDTDTHVGPSMDVLEPYMDSAERDMLAPFAESRSVAKRTGQVTYRMGARKYERRLGRAEPGLDSSNGAYMAGFTGAHKGREPVPTVDHDVHSRIQDMDLEGADVNLLLPSGWFGAFTTVPDLSLELAAFRAYNRWMADYCGAYPDRLGGVIILSGRDVEGGLRELARCANERWPWGIFVYAPYGKPLDHPDFEPYWAAAQEHDLSVVLHTFTVMPPYAPAVWTRGTICGCSAPRRIRGAACAIWHRSSAQGRWTAIPICESAVWRPATLAAVLGQTARRARRNDRVCPAPAATHAE